MKKYLIAMVIVSTIFACNNKEEEAEKARLKSVSADDSVLNIKTKDQDSTITAYVKTMNDIEDNLDSIKARTGIMTVRGDSSEGKNKKEMIITNMKYISELMMKNQDELNDMKKKLAASGTKNAQLKKMISRLKKELIQKDSDIAHLQNQLAVTNSSLKAEIQKFDDSMKVINRQNATISEQNKVHYAVGTKKDLKNKGVITKEGGVIGLGRIAELKDNPNMASFYTGDMLQIHGISLINKFDKLITNHPNGSYKIKSGTETDSLIITDQQKFWSESKYLVVITTK